MQAFVPSCGSQQVNNTMALQAKQQASTRTMAATMEAPPAPDTSQSYPTEAARRTAFSNDMTPELVRLPFMLFHVSAYACGGRCTGLSSRLSCNCDVESLGSSRITSLADVHAHTLTYLISHACHWGLTVFIGDPAVRSCMHACRDSPRRQVWRGSCPRGCMDAWSGTAPAHSGA